MGFSLVIIKISKMICVQENVGLHVPRNVSCAKLRHHSCCFLLSADSRPLLFVFKYLGTTALDITKLLVSSARVISQWGVGKDVEKAGVS